MDDDFLTAAILGWDDAAPPMPPIPAPRTFRVDPFVLLGILYALAAIVLGVRWYHARSR